MYRSCPRGATWRLSALASSVLTLLASAPAVHAQQQEADAASTQLETVQVSGNWLGTGLQGSVKNFAGARTVVDRDEVEASGAVSIGDLMRRIPGVQASENSGTAGSAISMNIGVRGLTGRYSPRSTVLLDGIPMAVAPYGQPQLSFAPVSLANIESVDVVRGGGAVRYGPQNVGGIINFNTRAIPNDPGFVGSVTLRRNEYSEGGSGNTQASLFLGQQLDSGLGVALLYSGLRGSDWRAGSDEHLDDLALKFRYEIGAGAEVYGKLSYFEVKSMTPGGLTVAQYNADPFQNTRPTDFWNGRRQGLDLGYLNTLSATQEFEIRTYYNESTRQSSLINAARTQNAIQPRDYEVLGIEPRYTQRLTFGATTHDLTLGYRFVRERGSDNSYNQTIATGANSAVTRFRNSTDAQAVYLDDKIAVGAWRITPGLRYEHIVSSRDDLAAGQTFDVRNNKPLPSLNVAYLLSRELTVFGNFSTSFGPVQNLQLNSQTPANPLKPELARTFELGGRWQGRGLSAELTAFRLKFDNQIQQVPGVTPTLFQNIGETKHEGIESALSYAFDRAGPLAGLEAYANYTFTRALQESGATAGRDVPFYSRNTDTVGTRYALGDWTLNLSSTHQSAQYSDNANTIAEAANASVGRIPGYRLWNVQASWKPGKRFDVDVGVNNLADKRYYTRNVDGNAGRMVGAPRTVYVQGRLNF
ncbi:TonB-dependent siderophore receptor [Paucibacter sp. R3-3]|uniref:TonB-dependent siderophore receptor n=1 Tax=Roseateles agri TaxID=3098619 RepID=A0ABU5DF58_9BURK|nr:TonB-dependent siderophore receptor [Paucibacter sp. R3-3]MDY0744908.1 TonB-dependent siderophore receptor [Paucibacter sp. R3-3]